MVYNVLKMKISRFKISTYINIVPHIEVMKLLKAETKVNPHVGDSSRASESQRNEPCFI
jgi:hypothetical protein